MKILFPKFLLHIFLYMTTLLHLSPISAPTRLNNATYFTGGPSPSPAPAPPSGSPTTTYNNFTEFIRTSCETTRYPELCYNSLSGYAYSVKQDPGTLAQVAIKVGHSKVKYTGLYFYNMSQTLDVNQTEPRAIAALHDCCSVFGDALDEMKRSLVEMKLFGSGAGGGGEEIFRFHMSNVQTWMSAALTDEDTCTDGLEGVSEGPMKRDISDRVAAAEKVTSNALALVNGYVAIASVS